MTRTSHWKLSRMVVLAAIAMPIACHSIRIGPSVIVTIGISIVLCTLISGTVHRRNNVGRSSSPSSTQSALEEMYIYLGSRGIQSVWALPLGTRRFIDGDCHAGVLWAIADYRLKTDDEIGIVGERSYRSKIDLLMVSKEILLHNIYISRITTLLCAFM